MISQSLLAFDDLLYGIMALMRPLISGNYSRKALRYEVSRTYYLNELRPGLPYNQELSRE